MLGKFRKSFLSKECGKKVLEYIRVTRREN